MKQHTIQIATALALLTSSVVHAQQAVQWKVAGGNGHWYRFVSGSLGCFAWWQANAESSGAHLASIGSVSEQTFLSGLLPGATGGFVGGTRSSESDVNLGWTWVTGEPFSPTAVSWAPGNPGCCAPSEFWLRLLNNGLHDGAECENGTAAFFEWSADCNADGIVDYGQCHDGTLPDYNGNNIPDCCEQGTSCVPGRYPLQWRAQAGGNGHWYQASANLGLTFPDARSRATELGGDLVTPQTPAELDFVFRNLASDPALWWKYNGIPRHGPWIGLQQDHDRPDYAEPAGGWAWIDGTTAKFQNWDLDLCQTQPSNCFCGGDCGLDNAGFYEGDPASGQTVPTWGAFAANMSERVGGVIIEWSADCNSDGIVDYGQILQGQLADANTNGIPDICEGPTCHDIDLNLNGIVDGGDLGVLLAFWGTVSPAFPRADINGDGLVNGADLGILLSFWGPCPG